MFVQGGVEAGVLDRGEYPEREPPVPDRIEALEQVLVPRLLDDTPMDPAVGMEVLLDASGLDRLLPLDGTLDSPR